MNYKNLNKHANIISISVSAASTTKNSESRFSTTSCHNTDCNSINQKYQFSQRSGSGPKLRMSNVNVKYQMWNGKCAMYQM